MIAEHNPSGRQSRHRRYSIKDHRTAGRMGGDDGPDVGKFSQRFIRQLT